MPERIRVEEAALGVGQGRRSTVVIFRTREMHPCASGRRRRSIELCASAEQSCRRNAGGHAGDDAPLPGVGVCLRIEDYTPHRFSSSSCG